MSTHGDALARRLRSISDVSDADLETIRRLPMTVRDFDRRQDIVRDGEKPTRCCLVVSGFTSRTKFLPDGRRQILAFHVPGDIPDLQSLHLGVMDHNLTTLTPCRLAFIDHGIMREVTARHPRLTAVLWRATLIDASMHREWTLAVGRLSAKERTAHLLCELILRLQAVGLQEASTVTLPITQTEMADALGLTSVSINRMLQELSAAGYVSFESRAVTVLNWEGLRHVGRFDPAYLHLVREIPSERRFA